MVGFKITSLKGELTVSDRKRATRQPRNKSDVVWPLITPYSASEAINLGRAVSNGEDASPNKFRRITKSEFESEWAAYEAARKDGKPLPSLTPFYQPPVIDHINRLNARTIQYGQPAKHSRKPNNWPSSLGEWAPGMFIAPHGHVRRCHQPDARKMVTNRTANIVDITIDNKVFSVVVGEVVDGKTSVPAVMLVNAGKTGNYAANLEALKQLSLASLLENNRPNNIVGIFNPDFCKEILDDGTTPGCELAWSPNSKLTWGYLKRGGNTMTPAQIRSVVTRLAAGETDANEGIEIAYLDAPLVGLSVKRSDWWTACQEIMAADVDPETGKSTFETFGDEPAKAWYNLMVQCRTDPNEQHPFGFFSVQLGLAPCPHFGGNVDEEMIRVVVAGGGLGRIGYSFRETRRDAKRRLGLTATAVAEKTTKKVTKKAAKKVVKKSPSKKTRPKSDIGEAAPVVETEVVVVEDVVENATLPESNAVEVSSDAGLQTV